MRGRVDGLVLRGWMLGGCLMRVWRVVVRGYVRKSMDRYVRKCTDVCVNMIIDAMC